MVSAQESGGHRTGLRRLFDSRALWSGVDAGAAPLASLIITFGLARVLDPNDYGILVIALAISAVSTAINPAIAVAVTKFVSESTEAPDRAAALARVVAASLTIAIAFDALLAATVMAFRDPLARLVFGDVVAEGRPETSRVLLLAIVAVCIQQIDGVFSATLRGLERFRKQALLEGIARTGSIAIVILTGILTKNVQFVLVAYCSAFAASMLLRVLAIRSVLRGQPLLAKPLRADFNRIFSFGGWMWLNTLANIAYLNFDRVLVGSVLGLAAAGEFNLLVQSSQLIHYVPACLFAYSLPVFSRLNAGGAARDGEVRRMYRRTIVAVFLFALLVALLVWVLAMSLLDDLLPSAFGGRHQWAFALLMLGFLVLSLNIAPYYLLLGVGRSRSVSTITALSVVAALLLSVYLIPRYGLEGAAIARFGYILGTLMLLERARRFMQPAQPV